MGKSKRGYWRGVHIIAPDPKGVPLLKRAIDEVLAPMGINLIVLEINYRFQFQSHPELRTEGALSRENLGELVEICDKHGIRFLPEFNCLGHQSWRKTTFPLLLRYPELDETPQIPKDNPDIYCRSWCPLHPKVNDIVFALMDELIESFRTDAFHVGMDEVFLIASDQCPRCRGKDPAELFAKAVNDYHRHLVEGKGLEMFMWGDRLLDDGAMGYGKWEASRNGTAPAIDLIPKDIIICDWHYGLRDEYPSVPYFQKKGFRVLPSSWKDARAALALKGYAERHATERMMGHLCTTWVNGTDLARTLLGEEGASETAKQATEALQACMVS